jgi:hypothetical protein
VAATHICEAVSDAATSVVPLFEGETFLFVLATEFVRIMNCVLTQHGSHMDPLADRHEILLEQNLRPRLIPIGPKLGPQIQCVEL